MDLKWEELYRMTQEIMDMVSSNPCLADQLKIEARNRVFTIRSRINQAKEKELLTKISQHSTYYEIRDVVKNARDGLVKYISHSPIHIRPQTRYLTRLELEEMHQTILSRPIVDLRRECTKCEKLVLPNQLKECTCKEVRCCVRECYRDIIRECYACRRRVCVMCKAFHPCFQECGDSNTPFDMSV